VIGPKDVARAVDEIEMVCWHGGVDSKA
jgi:hypothetical protein